MRASWLLLTLAALALAAAAPPAPSPPAPSLDEAAKVALGRRLFYDADLSRDGTMACATCHEQKRAFADGNRTHPGVDGSPARRNVMALANVGRFGALTWGDPGLTRLEDQVSIPVFGEHPVEMGMAGRQAELAGRLGGDACYRRMFAQAFPEGDGGVGMPAIAAALAAFQRTLISGNAPYDRFRKGDGQALSPAARRGLALFEGPRFACAGCHAGPMFTDAASGGDPAASFHDIGLPPNRADRGMGEKTGRPEDDGRFRTPSLRNVALTGPYMHDGSVATLAAAVQAHFAGAGRRDPRLAGPPPRPAELADLLAFMGALTDRDFTTDPRFSLPRPGCPAPP